MILTVFTYVKQVPDSYNYGDCKGCVFCGWQVGNDFHDFIVKVCFFLCMECLLIKENLGIKVLWTVKSSQNLENYFS